MRLEITLSEVQQFLSNQYQIAIDLKNIEENKIKATYIVSVVLIINEVKEDVILFHYEVGWLANIATKIARYFMMKELDKLPIEWDSKNKELKIDLNQISEMNTFLKVVSLSEINFIKDTIVLKMYAKGTI